MNITCENDIKGNNGGIECYGVTVFLSKFNC